MKKKSFKLSHLILGIAGLLTFQAVLLLFLPLVKEKEGIIFLFGIIGAAMNIYVAVEAIEEVESRMHVLAFLFLIVLEFIIFFAFQYWYLLIIQPTSFPTLPSDIFSLLLHSVFVFVFNPLYLPATDAGRSLLLVNTLSSLGLVLFILQNVWQLRSHLPRHTIGNK